MEYMSWLWLGAVILFAVVEAMVTGLVAIWFVVGAVLAFVVSLFGVSATAQLTVFVLGSGIALIATRPLVKKWRTKDVIPTNVDRLIGMTGAVTEILTPVGTVYIDGKTWTARSMDHTDIDEGEQVRVCSIEGVTLNVQQVK
ncbi:NfeD family protein [Bengtsoniella intestinalis]|uniref:NfeD family protein n=1 Tax=Bengtsoniella intestinalis TaxID=3073143 RepID=UPI00391FB581